MRNLIIKLLVVFVLCFTLLHNTGYASEEVINDADITNDVLVPMEDMIVEMEESIEETEITEESSVSEPVHEFFYDIPQDHYAYEAIDRLYQAKVINYREDHKFMPNAPISRAELIHMIVAAKGIIPIDTPESVFVDVDSSNPYASYIEIAHRLGIIDGVGNNQCRPGDPVKRDSLIKILLTSSGKFDVMWKIDWRERAELLAPFNDTKHLSSNSWVTHYVCYALQNNIISGYPDNTIRTEQYTTRAEAAVLVERMFLNTTSSDSTSQLVYENNGISIPYKQKLAMTATKYNCDEPNLSNRTHSGLTTRVGVVAVDQSIIPFGTHLYIEGYGYAVAADSGGAIKGNKIDLYARSIPEALKFGIQPVNVYILP